MPFRVSFDYAQVVGDKIGGWTENFWHPSPAMQDVVVAAQSLETLIENIHGDEAVLRRIRIAQVDGGRRVRILQSGNPNLITLGAGTAPPANDADYPTTALLIRITPVSGHHTLQWIKGIPDDQVSLGGRFTVKRGYQTSLNRFFQGLRDGGFCVRIHDENQPKTRIIGVTQAGVFSTIAAHGLVAGDRVYIGRVVTKGVNGVHRVAPAPGVTTFQLTIPPVLAGPAEIRDSSYVQKLLPVYQAIGVDANAKPTIEAVRVTEHRVGRPSGLLSGRRKRR